MSRKAQEPSTPSKLNNAPRGNTNNQASGASANNNVGRKSASLVGMETWAQSTQLILKARNIDARQATHQQVADKAYHFYKKYAVHQELLGQNNPLQKARNDMSMNGSRLKDNQATDLIQQARNEHPKGRKIGFIDDAKNENKATEDSNFLHLRAENGSSVKKKFSRNENKEKDSGFSTRLSITSDAFFDDKKSGIYASGALKRKKAQQQEFKNMADIALDWAANEKYASGGKLMGPKQLNQGRVDHAVLYSSSDKNIQNRANTYSSMLAHASKRSPMGMEPLAAGVSYAELLNHNKQGLAPGYSDNYESARHDKRTLNSFGSNRANIIASAIKSSAAIDNKATLNENLRNSIRAHGYDVNNPARVDNNNINVINHRGLNTNNHSNNNNNHINTQNANLKVNYKDKSKRSSIANNHSGTMQSGTMQSAQNKK